VFLPATSAISIPNKFICNFDLSADSSATSTQRFLLEIWPNTLTCPAVLRLAKQHFDLPNNTSIGPKIVETLTQGRERGPKLWSCSSSSFLPFFQLLPWGDWTFLSVSPNEVEFLLIYRLLRGTNCYLYTDLSLHVGRLAATCLKRCCRVFDSTFYSKKNLSNM